MAKIPHILFVDDELSVLSAIKRNLHRSRLDWTFSFVQSGEAAMALLEGDPSIDIVVTDVMMPGVDGYQLVKNIMERYPIFTPSFYPVIARRKTVKNLKDLAFRFFQNPFRLPT